jgi:hypothetical protein
MQRRTRQVGHERYRGRAMLAGVALVTVAAACGGPTTDEGATVRELETIRELEVGPQLEMCEAEGVQPCFVVHWEGDEHPTTLMDRIEGFRHEAGVTTRLRVRIVPIAEPLQDASSVRYELVEVLEESR